MLFNFQKTDYHVTAHGVTVTFCITEIYFVYKVSLNYRSFKTIAGCPPGSSSSRTARQAYTGRSARNWLWANWPDFITKDQWPPNSPNINQTNYHVWGAMLEAYRKLKTKPKTITEVKKALQVVWGNLPQGPINKAVKDISK